MNKKDIELLDNAWKAREYAYPWNSGVKVGCAIRAETGQIVQGWNIEGLWMTSIHAEVCAITQLIKIKTKGIAVGIVSDTKYFTPCGACLDWLFQFCNLDSLILIQNRDRKIYRFRLKNLCPEYPKK